jgi:hypothetical protein
VAVLDYGCAPFANRCVASVVMTTGEALLTVVVLRFVAMAALGEDQHERHDAQQGEQCSNEQRQVDGAQRHRARSTGRIESHKGTARLRMGRIRRADSRSTWRVSVIVQAEENLAAKHSGQASK